MARRLREDEADVALTEELRALLRPRARWPLVLLVLLLLALGVLAWVASRTLGAKGQAGGHSAHRPGASTSPLRTSPAG